LTTRRADHGVRRDHRAGNRASLAQDLCGNVELEALHGTPRASASARRATPPFRRLCALLPHAAGGAADLSARAAGVTCGTTARVTSGQRVSRGRDVRLITIPWTVKRGSMPPVGSSIGSGWTLRRSSCCRDRQRRSGRLALAITGGCQRSRRISATTLRRPCRAFRRVLRGSFHRDLNGALHSDITAVGRPRLGVIASSPPASPSSGCSAPCWAVDPG